MARPSQSQKYLWWVLTAAIIVGGFVFWQYHIDSDPPMNFSGLGQSLYTDPAQYVFHARNYTLYGQSDPFDYPKFAVFQNSLLSRFAYLWFSIAGVSLRQANLVGVFMSFGGLVFFVLGLARSYRPWVPSAVALCYVINVTLFIHGRVPYLENGLLLSSGAVFWIYSWWGDKKFGIVLSGVLTALAMLTGKLFGALLLPVLALTILTSTAPDRWKRTLTLIGSFAGAAILLLIALYAGKFSAVSGYFGEQTYGLYGFPPGLSSPWGFVESLISYGYRNRLFYLSPDLVGFFVIGGFFFARYLAGGLRFSDLPRPTVLALFWILFFVGGLMPLGYSPIRYAVIIIPAVITFGFTMLDVTLGMKSNLVFHWNLKLTAIFAFVAWVFVMHATANTLYFNTVPPPIRGLVWFTLPGAIAVAWLVRYILIHWKRRWTYRTLVALIIVSVAVSVVINRFRIRRYQFMEQNYNVLEASRDIAKILGPGAVISGPFGPSLTMNCKVKSFIHQFGVARVDSTLFDREPITHLAVDESNAAVASQNYPELRDLKSEASYWICDNQVQIYNISKATKNPTANAYVETDYERASQYLTAQKYDSALAEIERFELVAPDSKAGGMLYAKILTQLGQYDKANRVYATLVRAYPTDFSVHLEYGYFLTQLIVATKDRSMAPIAEENLRLAAETNPFKANLANELWGRFLQSMGQ